MLTKKAKSLSCFRMKLTYEQLEEKLRRTEDVLARALEEIARLHEKVAKLEDQLKRNSKNSSKPPSTDHKGNTPGATQKPPRGSRAGKARPSFPLDKIDRHIQCTQENCP